MKSFVEILAESIDLLALLKELVLDNETLGSAALNQGSLYRKCSTFYVQALSDKAALKGQLKEREAFVAQFVRQKDRERRAKSQTQARQTTEAQINERVTLTPSVMKLRSALIKAEAKEEWARLLLEAYKMRRDTIKILSDVLEDESFAELRVMRDEKAKQELNQVKRTLGQKYPRGEE